MRNQLTLLLTLCRNPEIRVLFFIGYLLLLMWPFFTTTPPSLWTLYIYYHSVWGVLIGGLALQGYLVITSEITPKDNHDD